MVISALGSASSLVFRKSLVQFLGLAKFNVLSLRLAMKYFIWPFLPHLNCLQCIYASQQIKQTISFIPDEKIQVNPRFWSGLEILF